MTKILMYILTVNGLVALALAAEPVKTSADLHGRPNILLAIGDDISWEHFGCYGAEFINTPTFDGLAETGVRFANAFSSAPGCSPSRAALLTGRHIWENEEAGTHASSFPAHLQVYPELLERSGYVTGYTGKPWAPGNWEVNGRKHNPAGPSFDRHVLDGTSRPTAKVSNKNYAENFRTFLSERPAGKPFCFWFGAHEAHRGFEYKSGVKHGKKLEDAVVPKFMPDNETTRYDMLDYALEIEWFDSHLGQMVQMLKEIGELENTLIVVTADNGMAFPRAKANNYEHGVHVPLIMSWPAEVDGNRVIDDPVSLIDLAPTFLEAAGMDVPVVMSGQSLKGLLCSGKSGTVDPSRKYVLSGRERHTHARADNLGYPIRAMHTPAFSYIRNLKPERLPAGIENVDVDSCPSHTVMIKDPESHLSGLAYGQRPLEELYSREKDFFCLNNLAVDPEYRLVMVRMWDTLNEELKKTGDPRVMGYGDIWDSYPRYSKMRDYPGFKKRGAYNPEYVGKALEQMKDLGVSNPAYEVRASK